MREKLLKERTYKKNIKGTADYKMILRRLTIVFRFSSTLTFDGFKKAK